MKLKPKIIIEKLGKKKYQMETENIVPGYHVGIDGSYIKLDLDETLQSLFKRIALIFGYDCDIVVSNTKEI